MAEKSVTKQVEEVVIDMIEGVENVKILDFDEFSFLIVIGFKDGFPYSEAKGAEHRAIVYRPALDCIDWGIEVETEAYVPQD